MTKKPWPCMVCEKRYAELEEAERCERSHDQHPREKHDDDGREYSDPRDYRDELRRG